MNKQTRTTTTAKKDRVPRQNFTVMNIKTMQRAGAELSQIVLHMDNNICFTQTIS